MYYLFNNDYTQYNEYNFLFYENYKTTKYYFFFRNYNKKDKSMLGRWGSVKDPNKKTTYGYDCANEFGIEL